MEDIRLDMNGDIDITNGEMSLTKGIDGIVQHLKQRLRFFYGEWFLDKTKGVPYIQQILRKNPEPVIVDSILKRAILETPGVLELLEFSIEIINVSRELKLKFKARAKEGEINFSEVIP